MKRISLLLSFFLLLNLNFPAYATSVLPMSLAQLSQQADIIFYGKVLKNHVETDPISGQIVTYTDFTVLENIKGQTNKTHSIKQLGGQLAGQAYALRVYGVPVFIPGKEAVVFLPKVSKLGFCSPVGLYQGNFNVETINDEKIISNGRHYPTTNIQTRQAAISTTNNPPVNVPLATSAEKPHQARLNDFISTVRAMTTK